MQTEPSIARPLRSTVGVFPYWQISILATLSLGLYWSTLTRLVAQWWHDPNFSHGFFVPLFSAFVVWQERDRLARIAPKPAWIGLAIFTSALSLLIVGQLGAEVFLARFSLLPYLAGIIILFLGWRWFRAVVFPWAFLLVMIPIPALIFNQIAFPLQLLVSRVSAEVLRALGVPLVLRGNILDLANASLDVAEACSGIRSLTSLLTLAIIYGYLLEKRLWVRWLLALASVPIAVAANCVRIVGTGLLVDHGYHRAAEGTYHETWGVIVFVLALLMLYATHNLTRAIWKDDDSKPIDTGKKRGVA